MIKRVLAVVLSVFLLAGTASGCNKKNTPNEANGSKQGETGGTSEEKLEHVTLDWYMALWTNYPDTDRVMAEVSKKIKEKLNATVNFHVSGEADYKTKVSTMLNAGQPMDMLYLSNSTVPFLENAQRGAFYPLEGLLEKYAPNIYKSISKDIWDAVTIDKHIYAVVPMKDLADSTSLMYDKIITDKYKINVPQSGKWTTVYDIMDFIYAMRDARNKEYPELAKYPSVEGTNFQLGFFFPHELISTVAGITIPGLEGFQGKGSGDTVFNIYDTPEYLKYCKTMRKFVEDGLYPNDAKNFNKDKAIDIKSGWLYAQGHVVPYKAVNPNYEMSESNYKVMTTSYVRAMLNAVAANSKNPERALMVLDLVNTDPYIGTMLRFGIENEHWKKVDDKTVTFKGTTNEDTNKRSYYHWYGAQWGGITNMFIPESVDSTIQVKIKELVEKSNKKTALGFVFDGKPVQNEIAACKNVITEYNDVLRYGMIADVEKTVAEFVNKLKENGSQKIVDEAQKQLTAWRASVGKK